MYTCPAVNGILKKPKEAKPNEESPLRVLSKILKKKNYTMGHLSGANARKK